MSVISLVPHDVTVFLKEQFQDLEEVRGGFIATNVEGEPVKVYSSQGVARIATTTKQEGTVDGIPLIKIVYGKPEGIPDFVKPEDIDDLASTRLGRDISRQIEATMQYPGQIKVTVIRETRAVDYAK